MVKKRTDEGLTSFPRAVIAGTNSGSGKTTVTMGLILALRARGYDVRPYKTGPDYIDPGFLSLAAGRPARNLDTQMIPESALRGLFCTVRDEVSGGSCRAPLSLIEGVMGLYDGFSGTEEQGSTAHVAKVLKAPVILLVSAKAMARSAAALVMGFLEFDRDVPFGGIIFNNLGSEKHYRIVKDAVELALEKAFRGDRDKISVLGYLPHSKEITLPERHLGLVPAWESKSLPDSVHRFAERMEETLNIDRIVEIAEGAPPLETLSSIYTGTKAGKIGGIVQKPAIISKTEKVKIAYALDDAFHFYYEDNLDILRDAGTELVPFSPIRDDCLPQGVGGIYLGGGYPELFASDLENNREMLGAVASASAGGLPIYAECGGLMYLMDELVNFEGQSFAMAGVFKGRVVMEKKLSALGYYHGTALRDTPLAEKGWGLWGHVFHWSRLEGTCEETFSFELKKERNGENSENSEVVPDGLLRGNTLAGYFHIHFAGDLRWPRRFVGICRNFLEQKK